MQRTPRTRRKRMLDVERELMKAAVPTDVETEDEKITRVVNEPWVRWRVLHHRIWKLEQTALDSPDYTCELPDDDEVRSARWLMHVLDTQILRDKDPQLDDLRDDVAVRIRTPEELLSFAMAERGE